MQRSPTFGGRTALFLSLSMLAIVVPGQGAQLPREAELSLTYYLNVDCLVGEKKQPIDQLLDAYSVLDPQLRTHFEQQLIDIRRTGPDSKTLQTFERATRKDGERRANFRGRGRLGALSVDDFTNERRTQFVRKYKQRAAVALAAIGSPRGIAELRTSLVTDDIGLQLVMKEALKRYER